MTEPKVEPRFLIPCINKFTVTLDLQKIREMLDLYRILMSQIFSQGLLEVIWFKPLAQARPPTAS